MGTLLAILGWAIFGLIVGAVARLLVPGRQPIGLLMTMLLGVAGAFAGGFLAWLFVGGEPLQATESWILSIVGAVAVLAVYVSVARRKAY